MPITSVEKDLDRLTITIVADFAAPLARVGCLRGPPPDRALLGSALLSRDLPSPRRGARRSEHLQNDRPDRRLALWLLGVDERRRPPVIRGCRLVRG